MGRGQRTGCGDRYLWNDQLREASLRAILPVDRIAQANELIGQVHTRMPVSLPKEHRSKWLGEGQDGDLKECSLETLWVQGSCDT
jgi:putative SOS response-associated peptidase YedK